MFDHQRLDETRAAGREMLSPDASPGCRLMQIADRKEADDVIALVHAIEPSGRAGIELPRLVARTGISPKRVERLLKRHSDYFVGIADQPKYALNRFRKFRGSPELVIADVERSYTRTARRWATVSILMFLLALLSFASMYLKA